MLEHGGRLEEAAARYGIARAAWLDLSTGINPCGYPVPVLPNDAWQRLPEEQAGLLAAAARYYGHGLPLVVAGSQAAIRTLPRLRGASRVAVLAPGYNEHAYAWRRHGHEVEELAAAAMASRLDRFEVLVVANPNNPTGERFAPEALLDWHAQLAERGGWLVVDEAFMDVTPAGSLASHANRPGLVVLRSLGKFFGMAGARVGFVFADAAMHAALAAELGPWTVAGPAQFAAAYALADTAWQTATRVRLWADSARLVALLTHAGLEPDGGTALFQWVCTSEAVRIHEALAQRAILTRLFRAPLSLRFGLPGREEDWQRLQRALQEVMACVA